VGEPDSEGPSHSSFLCYWLGRIDALLFGIGHDRRIGRPALAAAQVLGMGVDGVQSGGVRPGRLRDRLPPPSTGAGRALAGLDPVPTARRSRNPPPRCSRPAGRAAAVDLADGDPPARSSLQDIELVSLSSWLDGNPGSPGSMGRSRAMNGERRGACDPAVPPSKCIRTAICSRDSGDQAGMEKPRSPACDPFATAAAVGSQGPRRWEQRRRAVLLGGCPLRVACIA
jgi:hypothetical protein